MTTQTTPTHNTSTETPAAATTATTYALPQALATHPHLPQQPHLRDASFETLQVHAGHIPDSATGARAIPIYQSTSFVFPSAQEAADRFALASDGPIYTRLGNPTNAIVEDRLAALEGGVGALLTGSGVGAEVVAILTLAYHGANIVASPSLYGGTTTLLQHRLARLGIGVHFVTDPDDPQAWADAIDAHTVACFGESIPNPKNDILDIEGIAAVAHAAGVPLIIDNTVATPYLTRPFEWGADIVVTSATKYLAGHGSAIIGAVIDSGNFDFSAQPDRFPDFNTPDALLGNHVFATDFPVPDAPGRHSGFLARARLAITRDYGFSCSPFNAFLLAQGLETLSLRMERHVANAQRVAEFLAAHPQVTQVNYAGLPDSPYYQRHLKYCPRGAGAVLSCDLAGGRAAGVAFVDALQVFSNLVNIGDVRSLVCHPASTTHSQLNDEALLEAGITGGTLRLSIGIEHIDDIVRDLERGLAAAAKVSQ